MLSLLCEQTDTENHFRQTLNLKSRTLEHKQFDDEKNLTFKLDGDQQPELLKENQNQPAIITFSIDLNTLRSHIYRTLRHALLDIQLILVNF